MNHSSAVVGGNKSDQRGGNTDLVNKILGKIRVLLKITIKGLSD